MPVDFKYLPFAPEPLSGLLFIEQTEAAFNELGAEIDVNTAHADEALATANSAAQVAENALETAQDTVSTANTALTTANTALSNSTTALNTANTAYDNATNAVSVSNVAKDTADAASVTANDASATATQAVADITAAVTTANMAKDIAQTAFDLAASANDSYITSDAEIDADTAYSSPERSYLTNTANANFPIPAPYFFNVIIADNLEAVTQQCWNDETTLYRRYATIDNTDPDNPVVTWSNWAAPGSGSGDSGMPNTKKIFYASEALWVPPVDGWYKITLIGGGGGGGGGGIYQSGTDTALGAGAGGGAAGEVGVIIRYCNTTEMIDVYIGAGGAATAANSASIGAVAGKHGGSTQIEIITDPDVLTYASDKYIVGGGSGAFASVLSGSYNYNGGPGGLTMMENWPMSLTAVAQGCIEIEDTFGANGFAGEGGSTRQDTYMHYVPANGGNGGDNGTGFGGGGGGGAGRSVTNSATMISFGNPGRAGGKISRLVDEDDLQSGYLYTGASNGSSGVGGRGGDGAVIIEHFDPNL